MENEHLIALGRLTVTFGTLEVYLKFIFSALVNVDQRRGMLLASDLSFKQITTACRALAPELMPPEKNEAFQILLPQIVKIEERRNQFTHSNYAVEKGVVTRVKMSIKGRAVRTTAEIVTPESIAAVSDEIRRVCDLLKPFMDDAQKGAY